MWAQASTAMPTIAGTFSVPVRLPRSYAPPSMMLDSGIPCWAYKHPAPLRPVELVGREGQQVDVLCFYVNGQVARHLYRVGVEQGAPRRHTVPISEICRTEAISLLAYRIVTRAVSSRIAPLPAGQ